MSTKLKHAAAGLTVAIFLLSAGVSPVRAEIEVNLGTLDLGGIGVTSPVLNSAVLKKWRTGVANQVPQPAGSLTFQYLTGSNLALPSRDVILDNSANGGSLALYDTNDAESDNVVQANITRGTDPAVVVAMYTRNGLGSNCTKDVPGGLAATDNSGDELPLAFKIFSDTQLSQVSNANINGTVKISTSSAMFMATRVPTPDGGACPAEGPYSASTRNPPFGFGWCDYANKIMEEASSSSSFFCKSGQAHVDALKYAAVYSNKGGVLNEDPAYPFGLRVNPIDIRLDAIFDNAPVGKSVSGSVYLDVIHQ